MRRTLLNLGFHECNEDPNLYIRDGVIRLLYVDDLPIAHSNVHVADEEKLALRDLQNDKPRGGQTLPWHAD